MSFYIFHDIGNDVVVQGVNLKSKEIILKSAINSSVLKLLKGPLPFAHRTDCCYQGCYFVFNLQLFCIYYTNKRVYII